MPLAQLAAQPLVRSGLDSHPPRLSFQGFTCAKDLFGHPMQWYCTVHTYIQAAGDGRRRLVHETETVLQGGPCALQIKSTTQRM